MAIRTYRVILESDERHTYHAYVPALPGCHTWGATLDEAKQHVKDAIELYLTDLVESGETVPEEQSFDTFETVTVPQIV